MLARTATGTVSSHSQPLVCTTILPELAPGFKTLVSSLQCTTRVQFKNQNHGRDPYTGMHVHIYQVQLYESLVLDYQIEL